MRCYPTSVQMATKQIKTTTAKAVTSWRECRKGGTPIGNAYYCSHYRKHIDASFSSNQKQNCHMLSQYQYRIYIQKDMKSRCQRDTCSTLFKVAFYDSQAMQTTKVKIKNDIHSMEYPSMENVNFQHLQQNGWMELEYIMLSEISQTQTAKY